MKINLLFFANFREILDCSSLSVELKSNSTVSDLCTLLSEKGDRWLTIFDTPSKSVKIAVNQEMADLNYELSENDEVAFFPPVTGG
jgi:sulfur-carrier protein